MCFSLQRENTLVLFIVMFKVAELTTYILLMDNDDFVKNVSAVKVYFG